MYQLLSSPVLPQEVSSRCRRCLPTLPHTAESVGGTSRSDTDVPTKYGGTACGVLLRTPVHVFMARFLVRVWTVCRIILLASPRGDERALFRQFMNQCFPVSVYTFLCDALRALVECVMRLYPLVVDAAKLAKQLVQDRYRLEYLL